ncbi:MAG: DUF4157 domain-containing protein [Pseudomonadota bacterium]
MSAVAEKQVKTTGTARRTFTRPVVAVAWSSAPAAERGVMRAIVGNHCPDRSISGVAIRRACAQCTDELDAAQPAAQAQRAITVGPEDDEYEREADAMAEAVMRLPGEEEELPEQDGVETVQRSDCAADSLEPQAPAAPDTSAAAGPATQPPVAQRACAECTDELQREPLEGEEQEEERVQREMEAPGFGGGDEDDEGEVRRFLAPRPQMTITVGPADDEFEREADAVAERVMRAPTPGDETPEEEQTPSLQRRGIGREGGRVEDGQLAARLNAPGGGRPLPEALRSFMEPRLPYDFSDVRVHDSAEDRQDAARLNARAFTYGRHIWIGPGESADNPRLMAHELTHVVQQGAARRAVQRDEADEAQEPGFLARLAMEVLERFAPALVPVVRRGPVEWLKDRLTGAFNSLVGGLNRLNPAAAVEQLSGLFDALIARAEPIVTALRAGDCGPLFQAIDELKTFVSDLATSAWDGLVDFVRPVGKFFTDLWSGYGAPAVEWLQEVAGDAWNGIREFGMWVWSLTEPMRRDYIMAWNYLKELLFGPEEESSGNDSGGFVAWLQEKALQAWDAIKQETQPVWQPIVAAAEEIRALIPPAFVRRLGEQFRQLSANINAAGQQMSGGDDVAENRTALAAALPSVQQVIASVREIIVGARAWLLEKVTAVSGALSALIARLRGHALLRPLAGLLGWLDGAAARLAAWARDKVTALFGWVLRAFDFLSPFVQRLVAVVRNVITVAGDLMQLPSLILNAVWNLIPACIRDPIKDFIINQILRRIPVFSTLLELPDIWARVEATALRILRQVFVDGNLAGAAWTYFSAILEVLGIPPQLVVGILAKAASAIGDILANPVGFLLNLLSAIKEGFIRFFGNIGTHLLGGVTGWLFGHLTRAGIQPPQDFSLRSILGFVLQVLDITVDRVFERLALKLDPVIVQRLRAALEFATGAWRFVAILIEEGPAGLWREIQEQLGSLWNRVLDAVIGWLTRTIITRVSARLLTMLDPTGVMAVINSLLALYRAIESAVEYLREMLMIVDRVLDGINGIATGAIDIAAGFLETALASGIPVAIGFLANQIGLSDFGERIQEMVEGVREMVDRAIDWLIDRAIAGGQALINMLRRGVAAIRNWWAARKQFTSEEGEAHTLYFEGSGSGARLMIASDPQNYRDFIAGVDVPPAKEAAKTEAMQIATELDQAVARAGSAPATGAAATPAAGAGATEDDPAAEINALLDRLSAATARFIPRGSGASSEPVYGPIANGFGSSVRVERLTSDHPEGGRPSVEGGHWEALRRRQQGGGTYYVRGHLLNDNLGGPGSSWTNLTPLTQSANNRAADSMLHGFETPVKNAVAAGKRVNFYVSASYSRTHPLAGQIPALQASPNTKDQVIASIIRAEQYVPVTLEMESKEVLVSGEERDVVAAHTVDNRIEDADEEDYQLTPQRSVRVYINEMSPDELQDLDGVTDEMAQRIAGGAPYRTSAQVRTAGNMTESQWQTAMNTSGFHVRIYRLT